MLSISQRELWEPELNELAELGLGENQSLCVELLEVPSCASGVCMINNVSRCMCVTRFLSDAQW